MTVTLAVAAWLESCSIPERHGARCGGPRDVPSTLTGPHPRAGPGTPALGLRLIIGYQVQAQSHYHCQGIMINFRRGVRRGPPGRGPGPGRGMHAAPRLASQRHGGDWHRHPGLSLEPGAAGGPRRGPGLGLCAAARSPSLLGPPRPS